MNNPFGNTQQQAPAQQQGGGNPFGGPPAPQQAQQGQAPQQGQPAQLRSLDEILSGGSAPGIFNKTTPVGTSGGGVIVDATVQQCRDFKTRQPAWWDDGKPQEQIVVRVQTDLRDNADDDGIRGLYVETWGQNFKKFQEAVRAFGADSVSQALAPGGQFWARKIGTDPERNDKALYEYVIQAGPQQQQTTPPPAAPQQAPQQQAPAQEEPPF